MKRVEKDGQERLGRYGKRVGLQDDQGVLKYLHI